MRVRNMIVGLIGCVGLALIASNATAQVDYDQYNHLECYQIRDVKDGIRYTADVESFDTDMLPVNTLDKSCTFKKFSREYCVSARTQNVNPPPPHDGDVAPNGPVPQAFDYICYNVRCTRTDQPARGLTVAIKDRFGQRTVKLKKMKKLCVPIIEK